jgi:hypothetical protein
MGLLTGNSQKKKKKNQTNKIKLSVALHWSCETDFQISVAFEYE